MLQVKTNWSVLKTFYNDKKIPLIPPLLIDNKFVTDIRTKANIFNKLISKWAFNWKMRFNPDPHKPAQEVLFSKKKKVSIHAAISLNNIQVEKASYQKHLGLFLDEKLTFKHHIGNIFCKVNKGIAVTKILRHVLPRKSLLTIYKVFLLRLID